MSPAHHLVSSYWLPLRRSCRPRLSAIGLASHWGYIPLGRMTTRDRRYHRTGAPYTADARVPGQSVVIYSAWWAVTLNEQIAALATGATAILAGC